MIQGKNPRSVLVTMNIFNGQPVLVKSSQVYEVHSDGEYWQATEKLDIFLDLLIVDLNGAFDETDHQKISSETSYLYGRW
ncbi:unnamed protein product [Rotaria sp. Silwood2]|nr:unnamed protein product [Rotaria sp. Silwood2]CAF4570191.1 unnamed protein product [Rotaria sp. Silwood2]CAF4666993.1 unnamed protein product [Rotaria sp. Silwood2]CAF4757533.1 unnamed protein product [Rotaria sp. Silwood2]